jgi:hypothetical protein
MWHTRLAGNFVPTTCREFSMALHHLASHWLTVRPAESQKKAEG